MIFLVFSFIFLPTSNDNGSSKTFKATKWRLKKTFCVCFQLTRREGPRRKNEREKLRAKINGYQLNEWRMSERNIKTSRDSHDSIRHGEWAGGRRRKKIRSITNNRESTRNGWKSKREKIFNQTSIFTNQLWYRDGCFGVINQSLFGGWGWVIDHLELKAHLSRA